MINRIVIKNFKSIYNLDLELKSTNILIGANGAGKSNFLSFFKFPHNLVSGRLEYLIRNNIDSFLYFGRKESKAFQGICEIDHKIAISFAVAPTFGKNTGHIQDLTVRFNSSGVENYELWEVVHQKNNIDGADLYAIDDRLSEPIMDHFDNLNVFHFQDVSDSSPIKRENKINDNRNLKSDASNLAAFLYLMQEKHPDAYENIVNQVRSVAPFFERFDLAPDRLNSENIELRWRQKGASDYFNAYDISDGTLRFIALATVLLQAELPKLIIIDEPEIGLHPFAINKLAAMIKQASVKGSQVIISTQSVNLIDNFEPEDIITVDRADEQSVFKRLKSEDLESWLEDYTIGDLWNKNVIGARP